MKPDVDENLKNLCWWVYYSMLYITHTFPFFPKNYSIQKVNDSFYYPYTNKTSTLFVDEYISYQNVLHTSFHSCYFLLIKVINESAYATIHWWNPAILCHWIVVLAYTIRRHHKLTWLSTATRIHWSLPPYMLLISKKRRE